jgi:hypothetical protein
VKKSNSSVKKSNSSVKKRLFFTLSSVRKSRFDKENLFYSSLCSAGLHGRVAGGTICLFIISVPLMLKSVRDREYQIVTSYIKFMP